MQKFINILPIAMSVAFAAIICTAAIKGDPLTDKEPPEPVHISTEYVFANKKEDPAPETGTEITIPAEMYIKPKIAAESLRYKYFAQPEEDPSEDPGTVTARDSISVTLPPDAGYTDLRHKVKEYQKSLPDVYGYLDIPDTAVHYPVMHPPLDKPNDYYLSKDIYGNYEYEGSIFIDQYSPIEPNNKDEKSFWHLYGHNMANGSMFAGLNNFKESSFTSSHPYFNFSTADTAYVCTIIGTIQLDDAVALSTYRYDYPWQTPEQFSEGWNKLFGENKFSADEIKNKMDSGVKYMILHTCSSRVYGKKVEEGRFIVIAECVPAN